jgi:uncharacterized protein involved in type VI secretion and phage assembly
MIPLATEREAEGAAGALAERLSSGFAEVEGSALGSTALRAGVAVRVIGVSDEFTGTYVLSHTRHVIDGSGYRTHFTISGHHDRSLLGLVASGRNGSGQRSSGHAHPSQGLVRGQVAEIDDPDKLGRVRVKLPWLDDQYSSPWAPVLQLGAGPQSGTFFLPAVDDEVLIGFDHGQMDQPIVIGGLFNNTDQPPTYDQFLDNGHVTGRSITSRVGHEIVMYDSSDLSGIIVSVVDDNRNPVASVALVASDKKLVIHADGAVDISADGDINLKGKKITVAADGDLVLTGSTIKLN